MSVQQASTALFVPGDRPDRFEKAAASGAQLVIIDLEDAVSAETKTTARQNARTALVDGALSPTPILVRVNGADTLEFNHDLQMLHEVVGSPNQRLGGVMLAKAEKLDDLAIVSRALQLAEHPVPLVPLIESARGVAASTALAQAPGVARLAFGALDFALDIDADGSERSLDFARSWLVIASRTARIGSPLDSPTTELVDMQVVRASTERAKSLGFGGKLCIHPRQVAVVADAFAPTDTEIAWARTIAQAGGGVTQVAGVMVDRPVVERAQRILRRAGALA